jgi:hypothetical protein
MRFPYDKLRKAAIILNILALGVHTFLWTLIIGNADAVSSIDAERALILVTALLAPVTSLVILLRSRET